MSEQVKIQAVYDKDTFRCHRYFIKEAEGIKGTIYVNKDADVPKQVIIEMKVEG